MNILFLSTHLNSGGITSYLALLTKGLVKNNHKVFIASSGGETEQQFQDFGAELFTLDIRTKSELSPKIYLALTPLKKIIKEYNIDVIHSQTRITQVIGQLIGHSLKIPYVSTCHGFFKTRLSRKFIGCWGDRVVAISPAVGDHLINDFNVSREKVKLISHGLEIDKYPLVSEEQRNKKRKDLHVQENQVIGIIARLSDVKGHEFLIKAMPVVLKKFTNARLMVVGEGKMEEGLRHLVNELHLNDNVSFHPVVNQTAEMLSAFDVFVMPSIQEGLGLSVMEAQACGIPVVASKVGGLPSLVENGQTGLLVESQNVQDLAQAIIKTLEDKTTAKQMADQARNRIVQEFTIDKMIEKTEQMYKDLCELNNG